MTFVGLVFRSFAQQRTQVILGILCVAIAFFLMGVLMALQQAFQGSRDSLSALRLRSQNAVSTLSTLPVKYAEQIRGIDGVRAVAYVAAIPAAYQDSPTRLMLQAISPQDFLEVFPELQLLPDVKKRFIASRDGLLVGKGALSRYGWRLGQEVILQTNVAKEDGDPTWKFTIVGLYDSDAKNVPSDLTFVHYEYINEGRVQDKDQSLGLIVRASSLEQASATARRIDSYFEASSPRTFTQLENQSSGDQLAQFGDFKLIVRYVAFAVFLSVLLLLHNISSDRIDMRRRDYAVLKSLGFSDFIVAALVSVEVLILVCTAASVGLAAAYLTVGHMKAEFGQLLPNLEFPRGPLLFDLLAGIGFTWLVASLPALRTLAIRPSVGLHAG